MADIRRISAAETIAVRWPILRPGLPRATAVFDGDDAEATRHFGAYDGAWLVGVASIYRAPMPGREELAAWQLRGMATLPKVRGAGHGSALAAACEEAARAAGGAVIWCNARVHAAPFYEKRGWRIEGDGFDIPTVGPHFRMWLELQARA